MNDTNLSRYISYLLRHNPEDLSMTSDGYVEIESLIKKVKKEKQSSFCLSKLKKIVETDNKQRYKIKGKYIRANQGHSISFVDIKMKEVPLSEAPEFLYHGTTSANVNSINNTGIKKGKRKNVHLSPDIETATSVGYRHVKKENNEHVVIYKVETKKLKDKLYISDNGVYQIDYVGVECISII